LDHDFIDYCKQDSFERQKQTHPPSFPFCPEDIWINKQVTEKQMGTIKRVSAQA